MITLILQLCHFAASLSEVHGHLYNFVHCHASGPIED